MNELRFFGEKHPAFDTRLFNYLLSFLDDASLKQAALVNKNWNEATHNARRLKLLSDQIISIPLFKQIGLPKLDLNPMVGGMTNGTYKVRAEQSQLIRTDSGVALFLEESLWVLRIPGDGSSAFIDRQHEKHNANLAANIHLNAEIAYQNESGLQLTRFLSEHQPLTKSLLNATGVLSTIATALKTLHQSEPFTNTIDIIICVKQLLTNLKEINKTILSINYEVIELAMTKIENLRANYHVPTSPCHNDPTLSNFLLWTKSPTEQLKLIDWEYSGNNDCIWDLTYFAVEARLSREQELLLLKSYFKDDFNEDKMTWFELYKPVVFWWITLWSWTQVTNHANSCPVEAYVELARVNFDKTIQSIQTPAFECALKRLELKDDQMKIRPF